MTFFYILILIMLAGFTAIGWILISEKKKESPAPEPNKPPESKVTPKEMLNRLGLEPAESKNPLASILPKPATKTPESVNVQQTPGAPRSAVTATSTESELSLKIDELAAQNKDLKDQYAKLETLFAEKSMSLEKSDKALNTELKNQKEYHKVKDLLEKELKDAKDKIKSLQADVSTAQTETQTHVKRVSQLEEKVKKLEMEVLASEAAINDANAGTQMARKRVAELEEKLRGQDNQILEKNQKIEDLVIRLKDLPAGGPMPTAIPEPEPPAAVQPPVPPPQLPPADNILPVNVDEKGGGKKTEDSPVLPQETIGEDKVAEPQPQIPERTVEDTPRPGAIDEKSILKAIEAPETLQNLEQQKSENPVIERPDDGVLSLPPDIFAKPNSDSKTSESTDTTKSPDPELPQEKPPENPKEPA